MSISTYFRPNIHQNGPEILGVKLAGTGTKWPEEPANFEFGVSLIIVILN
jgi:hypothetical protein